MLTLIRKQFGIVPNCELELVEFELDSYKAVLKRAWISLGILIEAPTPSARRKLYKADRHDDLEDGSLRELIEYILTPRRLSLVWIIAGDNRRHQLQNVSRFTPGRKAIAFPEVMPP